MNKFAIKATALMLSALGCLGTMTACGGDDDDDNPDQPGTTNGVAGPTSITAMGQTLFSFTYDSSNRLTSVKSEDFKMTVSYSPFKVTMTDEDDYSTTTLSDVSVNSQGYVTRAKVTDKYDGETDVYSSTFEYDSEGHLIKVNTDGDVTTYSWSNGNLTTVSSEGYPVASFTYSDTPNTAQVTSPFWGDAFLLTMTNAFGKTVANFPATMLDYSEKITLAYELNPNGTIKTETLAYDDISLKLTYNYAGRALSTNEANPFAAARARKVPALFRKARR